MCQLDGMFTDPVISGMTWDICSALYRQNDMWLLSKIWREITVINTVIITITFTPTFKQKILTLIHQCPISEAIEFLLRYYAKKD